MNKSLILAIVLVFPLVLSAQEKEKKKNFGIKFSGFVKNDFFMDTRQTVAAREGHFLLWPKGELLDANNVDLNEGINTNFLAIQSRLSGKITGPDALGAKTSGLIEGDFFAQANGNINLFRLRHAFVKFNWETTELLMGQYWNPLFVTDCFPGTVSFNTGAPIQPFARNPQIRLTQKFGSFKLILAALEQRDYTSRGPAGVTSDYLRNSGIPDIHAQLHFKTKFNTAEFVTGFGYAYKVIKPRLYSQVMINDELQKIDVNETLASGSVLFFAKLKTQPVTIKVEAVLGENLADVLSISGFAMQNIIDLQTGEQAYTPLTNRALWLDMHTNGKTWQLGMFAGMNSNLGTKQELSSDQNPVWGLGTDVTNLYRVSPRVVYNTGKVRLGAEIEYTAADVGSSYVDGVLIRGVDGLPKETKMVANTRLLFAVFYFF